MDNEQHITNPGTVDEAGTGAAAAAEPEAASTEKPETAESNETASVETQGGGEKNAPETEEKNAAEGAEGAKAEGEKDKPEAEKKPENEQKYRYEEAELRAACALAGVPKERIPYALRVLDKGAVKSAEDAEQQVAKLLEDMPEFGASAPANGTGSNGNFARKAESEAERINREFLSGMMGGI